MSGILTKVAPIAKLALKNNLFNDSALVSSAVYRRFMGNAPDPLTGKNKVTYDDIPVDIVEMKHTADSVKSSSAKAEIGSLVFLLQFDAITFEPTTRDVISIATRNAEYAIKGIDKVFNILFLLTVVDRKNTS